MDDLKILNNMYEIVKTYRFNERDVQYPIKSMMRYMGINTYMRTNTFTNKRLTVDQDCIDKMRILILKLSENVNFKYYIYMLKNGLLSAEHCLYDTKNPII